MVRWRSAVLVLLSIAGVAMAQEGDLARLAALEAELDALETEIQLLEDSKAINACNEPTDIMLTGSWPTTWPSCLPPTQRSR